MSEATVSWLLLGAFLAPAVILGAVALYAALSGRDVEED